MPIASPKAAGSSKAAGLYAAILAFQAEAPSIQKTAINPHFGSKFAPLDKVHEAVIPLLNKNGLAWLTLPGVTENGNPVLHYHLRHVESGEEVAGTMPLLPSKADPQGQGSAITYARRYSLMAVLGLVADEDDDGNAGSNGKGLADAVSAIVGTTELATRPQLAKLDKAKELLGAVRFDAYLAAQGVDSPEALTKDAAESVLTWARNQAKQKAAA